MQLKVFVLPVRNLGAAEAEMNAFLRGHRVLAVKMNTATTRCRLGSAAASRCDGISPRLV